ncbi:hypothetical protein B0T14DRAFT_568197 [Immersiella caudata]|uniref:Uncharacterized protein n=1 Tax=Immersiella caudata TaxID=314043 RepID=A0AA40BWS6_9PEZI|nr:hypothetical protein B0T14DRAFT_568197 [Immersiella caudata]
MEASIPVWDYFPEYRIRSDVLQLWLQYIFQDGTITVQGDGQNYAFFLPQALTQV